MSSDTSSAQGAALPHRAGPWAIGRLSARLAQARFDRRRLGGRGGPADSDRLRRDYRARAGRRTLRRHPGTIGLRGIRHVPALDRESGRGHLCDHRSNTDAAGRRQFGSSLLSLSVVLAIFTGLFCVAASLLRLGFLADFLSRPILTGFLNGVAISIFLGQIGKVFGFPMQSHGIIPSLIEFVRKLPQTHLPTLAVGLLAIAVMLVSKRLLPRWPGPLLAVVAAVAVVKTMGLDARGVAVVGNVPAGLPRLSWPTFDPQFLPPLFGGALGVALVSFCNAMVVARSFAAKNHYEVDADRELFALGASQFAAGLCQGFAVSGTESRTAMNHAMGGKSQAAGLVAAAVMAAVLLFLTGPLSYLPKAAPGAVLIFAAIGLFDLASLRRLWRVSRSEFGVAIATMLGVIALDVLEGIVMAVSLALLLLLKRSARPPDAVLVRVPGMKGFHDLAHHADASATPGLLLYRFGAGIVFYNASYLKKRVLGSGGCPTRPEMGGHRRQYRQHD